MALKHDFEEILDEVKLIMIDKLNAKLLAVSADKNDGIILPPIDDKAYFLQSLDEEIANFDPFIAYGVTTIETDSRGPFSAEKIFIGVTVVLADNGIKNINRILFRYSRALKEIFQENWQIDNTSSKINIIRHTVVPFEALDSGATYKAIGIEIEFNLS